MSCLLCIILINFLSFYSYSETNFVLYAQLEAIIISLFAYKTESKNRYIFALLFLHYLFMFFAGRFLNFNNVTFISYNILLLLFGSVLYFRTYNYNSGKINKKNICLLFKKPVKLSEYIHSFFGAPCSSFSMLAGALYTSRYKCSTIQKEKYTDYYVYKNYIVIDTGVPVSSIDERYFEDVLKQKSRQPKTLFLRYNCLRSFRFILNQLKGYEYRGELFPCLYLRRIYKNAR